MRRNVGQGRGGLDGDGAGAGSGLSRRSTSPHNFKNSPHNFQRKHAVLFSLAFFSVVYLVRSWRGSLRTVPPQQQHEKKELEVAPPLPKEGETTLPAEIVWRGAHQSLSLTMDVTANVSVCGEGKLFFVDMNDRGWHGAELLDKSEVSVSSKTMIRDSCCKQCTEVENCNAFLARTKECSLYRISASEKLSSAEGLADVQTSVAEDVARIFNSDIDLASKTLEPTLSLVERSMRDKLIANELGFALDDDNDNEAEFDVDHPARPLDDRLRDDVLSMDSVDEEGEEGPPLPEFGLIENEKLVNEPTDIGIEFKERLEVTETLDIAKDEDDESEIPLDAETSSDDDSAIAGDLDEALTAKDSTRRSKLGAGDQGKTLDFDEALTGVSPDPDPAKVPSRPVVFKDGLDELLADVKDDDDDVNSDDDDAHSAKPLASRNSIPLVIMDEDDVASLQVGQEDALLVDDDKAPEHHEIMNTPGFDESPDISKRAKVVPKIDLEDLSAEDDEDVDGYQKPVADIPKKISKPVKSALDLELEGNGDLEDEHHDSLDDLLNDEEEDLSDEFLGEILHEEEMLTKAAVAASASTGPGAKTKTALTSLPLRSVASKSASGSSSSGGASEGLEDVDELFSPSGSATAETLLSNEANQKIANNPLKNILVAGVYGVTINDPFYQQKSKFFGRFRAVSEIHDFLTEWQAEYSKPVTGRSWQVDMFTLGRSGEGKMIKAIEFGNPNRGKHVFVIGGLKGCDWVGPLATVHSIVALVGRKRTTAHLLDSVRFHVVPLVNVDGYHYSRRKSPSNARHWCDNRRISGGGHGVNLERNWGEDGLSWGFGKKGKEGRKDKHGFQGLTGFSEPETKAVRDYIEHYATGHGRVAVVQVRCCGGTVTTPQLFGNRLKDSSAATAISQGASLLVSNIRVAGEGKDYPIVKRPDTFSADNTGQLIDWTTSKGADYSYAVEIKALSVATYNDRYQINPESFMSLCKELEISMTTIAQLLLAQPVQGPAPVPLLFHPNLSAMSASESSSTTEKKFSSSKSTKKKSSTA